MALFHKMGSGQRKREWELSGNPSVPGFVNSDMQMCSYKMLLVSNVHFTQKRRRLMCQTKNNLPPVERHHVKTFRDVASCADSEQQQQRRNLGLFGRTEKSFF